MNCRLTGTFADGWLPVYTPPEDVTVAPVTTIAVTDTTDAVTVQAKRSLAQAMAVGYNGLVSKFGFGTAADEVPNRWHDGDRTDAANAISDEMVSHLAIAGTPVECRAQLREYERRTRVDVVVVRPPYTSSRSEIEGMIEALEPSARE